MLTEERNDLRDFGEAEIRKIRAGRMGSWDKRRHPVIIAESVNHGIQNATACTHLCKKSLFFTKFVNSSNVRMMSILSSLNI